VMFERWAAPFLRQVPEKGKQIVLAGRRVPC
jgi:hypothetical protein